MIHLTLHKTSAEYEAVKENLENPQVSFIKETNVVVFKKGTSSLYLSAYSLSFDSSGQTNSIAVTSTDGQWTATTASDWLTISPLNGNEGETSVSITASENGTDEARTAQISFSNGTTTRSLNISQETSQVTPYSERYLTLDILTGGTVMWKTNHSASTKTISYSINDGEWTEITSTTAGTTFNVSAGDKVRLKGNNSRYSEGANKCSSIADGTAYFNAEGNIMSLIGGDNFTGLTELTLEQTFRGIFNQSNIVSAENLVLPPTNVSNWSYTGMFYGCTSLTAAPELPATVIGAGSYYDMFKDCTSLTVAPEIHATNVASESCRGMFYGCTSLTAVTQALPATTLAGRCYYDMFKDCTSLTSAPVICATTVASGSCYCMFCNCSSLTTAPALPSTALAADCYDRMFDGCTSLTTAPLLPATTIYTQSYRAMFSNCSSLTVAPVICATTLAASACALMFYSCTSLTVAPELPAMTLADSCYYQMFSGCISLTTAPELPATTLADNCYKFMFTNCTGLATAQSELPATTLANGCYHSMFAYCSNITASPVLPAPSLVAECYLQMFKDCKNLKYVKCLATDISATSSGKKCTWEWFYHVQDNSGCTFIKDSTMNDWTRDVDGIPSRWTVYDDTHIVVTGVSLNAQTATTNVGSTYALTATVSPSNASNKNITWSTSDSNVATVDSNGVVSGISCGNAVITVVTEEIGYSAQCEVTVENPVTGVSLNTNSVSVGSGGTYQLTATVSPSEACDASVTWASDNASVATVDSNGLVSAVTTGSATITVTTVDGGYTAQCQVTVTETKHPYGITISDASIDINVGYTHKLTVTITPSDALNKNVTWSTSDSNVATVDSNGVVSGIADGSAIITVTTVDGGLTAQCQVSVNNYLVDYFTIESLENSNTISLSKGGPNISLSYSLDDGESWTDLTITSNTNFATINSGDKILFKGTNSRLATAWNSRDIFKGSKRFIVYGNAMSLLYGDSFTSNSELSTDTTFHLCGIFFQSTNLVDAANLILPSTVIPEGCYNGMFREATNLQHGPRVLPGLVGTNDCYASMFETCINLEDGPDIKMASLVDNKANACLRMFCMNRSSMITTPKMTKSPILRVTDSLGTQCYGEMFKGNGNLVEITCLLLNPSTTACNNWLQNASSTGTLKKAASASWTSGVSGVPAGWTTEDYTE